METGRDRLLAGGKTVKDAQKAAISSQSSASFRPTTIMIDGRKKLIILNINDAAAVICIGFIYCTTTIVDILGYRVQLKPTLVKALEV